MWKRASKYLLAFCVALFVAAGALLWMTPTSYKVDFDAVLDIWGDIIRDVDSFTKTATRVSVGKEIEAGDTIASHAWLTEETGTAQAYIDGVGQRIAAHARRQEIPFRFHVVRSSRPNAWAIAGGHIYITTSLLGLVQSEAELAAILGHEIAHVDLRHCIELLQYELLLRRAGFGDITILVSIAEQLVRFGYSEVQEREADRLGLLLATEAGYAPLGALDAFERMYLELGGEEAETAQTSGPEGEITRALSEALEDYFATHPPFLERMDELRALLDWNTAAWEGQDFYVGASNHHDRLSRAQDERAAEFVTYSASSTDYLIARGKIASLVGRSSEAMSFFREALEKDPQLLQARKGLAAVYLQIGKAEEALDQFAQIIAPLQIRLSALEEELAALPSGDPSIEMDPLNRLIALLEEIGSLQRAGLDIMEKAQLPTLEEERRMLKELEEALLDARARRAELYMMGGRLDEALSEFRAVKSARPNSLEAIKGEISALKAKGWHFAALEATRRAVSRFPEAADFLRIRADLYDLLGREEEAEREMARYTRFAEEGVPPLTDEAWADFARMLDHLFGAKAMAISNNGKSRAISSGKFLMRTAVETALAECASEAGQDCVLYALSERIVWGEADAALDRLVEAYDEAKIKEAESRISPRDLTRESFLGDRTLNAQIGEVTDAIRVGQGALLLLRANLFRQLGLLPTALKDANAYLDRFPKSLNGRLLRGTILLQQRDYENALADFREITTDAPDSEQSSLSRAGIVEIHLQNDDFEAAVQEFRSADLPRDLQPLLDHGMCLALARRALPAAALPYCEAALRSSGGEGQAEYHDTKAFVLWQLRREEEARLALSTAYRLDPQRPIPFARMGYFRVLITEIFLLRESYISGRVDGRYDASTASAVARYRSREGLPRGGIDENLIGRITPLGFFAYRIEGIRDQLAPDFIKMSCVPATRGKYKTIRAANGRLYVCNSDGVSVRPLRSPPRLDYESRAEGEWLRCYDPDRDMVFSLDPSGPPSSLRSCGGTAYRISEGDYRKLQER